MCALNDRCALRITLAANVDTRLLMAGAATQAVMSANSSYDDLIEISACTLVLSDLTGREVPRRVHELISEAADLRGAWDGFPEDRGPGTTALPLVDAVVEDVLIRANALRIECFNSIPGTDEYAAEAPRAIEQVDCGQLDYGPETLASIAAQMRRALGRG